MHIIDTHVHSIEGSPCGKVNSSEIVLLYKENGYDGIVLTNHFNAAIFERLRFAKMPTWQDKIKGYLASYYEALRVGAQIGLRVYLGIELSNNESRNEYLIYGVTEDFLLAHEYLYSKPLAEIKKIVDENNLLLIQAHPCRHNAYIMPIELIDGVEGFNGNFKHDSNNATASRVGKKIGKIITSGSDFHDFADLGNGGVIFKSKPQNDNIAEAFRTIPYKLIRTKPQYLEIMILDMDEDDVANPKDILSLARGNGADLIVLHYNGDENKLHKVKNEIKHMPSVLFCNGRIIYGKECTICRTSVFPSLEGAEKNNIFEPTVVICDEITPDATQMLNNRHITAVIAAKSGRDKPYKIGKTKICGFDNDFPIYPKGYMLSITGSYAHIGNINI